MTKIDVAKRRAELLCGMKVKLKVNEGRNRFVFYEGNIDKLYPCVFTFKAEICGEERTLSFSYVDMLTKKVKILELR